MNNYASHSLTHSLTLSFALSKTSTRKRKFTDKSLPSSMLNSTEFPDSKFYQQLLDMERKLDWTVARKRAEIQDALGKANYVCFSPAFLYTGY